MSSAAPAIAASAPQQASTLRPASAASLWRAPLAPAAVAVTAGIVVDRFGPAGKSVDPYAVVLAIIAIVLVFLAAWLFSRARPGVSLVYLWCAVGFGGAAYHHWWCHVYPAGDIGDLVTDELRLLRVRGTIADEPAVNWQLVNDPLRSMPRGDPTSATLSVTAVHGRDDWLPVTGRVRLVVAGHLTRLHIGDEVEVVGRLRAPHGPANPGEFDQEAYLRDQRIRAVLVVQKTTDGVTLLSEGWRGSVGGWLAVLRGWGNERLQESLPADVSGVAGALLLGEGSTMTNADWDKYKRTGVIHALAISGQHLVVLAAFLWLVLRTFGVRRQRGALFVALFLLGYAFLTGGRPPAMRAAVMVCAAAGALLLRRPVMAANSFALAWLVVAAINPTDLFNDGCQLSFLAVAVLYWCSSLWQRQPDPLEQLIDESRPAWQRLLRSCWRGLVTLYLMTLIVWLIAAPLVASRYHTVSPVGLLLGPPLAFLASIALITGFLLLLASIVFWPLVPVFAFLTTWCLRLCEWLVDRADALPGGHWYVGDIPEWWLWGFYPAVLAVVVSAPLRRHWRWGVAVALAWLCVGLLSGSARPAPEELRITFLAVGHGGCTVIETPDGRVLLYDAGTLGGPEVTARQIAPYLWSRGIRRVDEVLLSHADLDHFNGLVSLLDRFAVGQVTCTPTFADKTTAGVRLTLDTLQQRRVPVRIVSAGARLSAGDVDIDVLHPPPIGPDGNENARSMVLAVRHAGHVVLLTGDLEGPGLQRVLGLPQVRPDVLMAPHHGSKTANLADLASWALPRLVVSCEGPPRSQMRGPEPYSGTGALFLGTWPHGAVTITSRPGSLVVETFQSKQRILLRRD
jgi:competence protein ComEC